jgi:hypothetical protein
MDVIKMLEAERDRLQAAINILKNGSSSGRGRTSGYKLSAAGRAKISVAMKKRWAERKKKAKASA